MMTPADHLTVDKFGWWSGVAFLLSFGLGAIVLAGIVPPHDPALSGEAIAEIYANRLNGIRAGMVVVMFASAFFYIFNSFVAQRISELEGRTGTLSMTSLSSGLSGFLIVVISAVFFEIAAFRQDIDPDIMRSWNDAAWLMLVGPVAPALPQLVALTFASFFDRRDKPVFPRWYGYLCIWVVLLLLCGMLCFFFKDGPFAWDGFFPFYLAFSAFGSFVIATLWILRADIKRRQAVL